MSLKQSRDLRPELLVHEEKLDEMLCPLGQFHPLPVLQLQELALVPLLEDLVARRGDHNEEEGEHEAHQGILCIVLVLHRPVYGRNMTLDEAIEHAETQAKILRMRFEQNLQGHYPEKSDEEAAAEQQQIAEWLKELQERRAPIPMILFCPLCHARHVDQGDFATRPHHSHSCQACGLTWRPAINTTVGVQFLPGFKDHQDG